MEQTSRKRGAARKVNPRGVNSRPLFPVPLSDEERAVLKAEADFEHLPLATWARAMLLKLAAHRREKRKATKELRLGAIKARLQAA